MLEKNWMVIWNMEFNKVERQSLVVWLYTLKQLKNIRKFGHVQFISKRLRYVILYINRDEEKETIEKLTRLHFVKKVEISHRDEIDMTWKDAIPNRKDKDATKKLSEAQEESDALSAKDAIIEDTFLKELKTSLLSGEQ